MASRLTGILPGEINIPDRQMTVGLMSREGLASARDLRAASPVSNMERLSGRTIQSQTCLVLAYGLGTLTPRKRTL